MEGKINRKVRCNAPLSNLHEEFPRHPCDREKHFRVFNEKAYGSIFYGSVELLGWEFSDVDIGHQL